jgi:hypothetical protein
MTLDKLKELLSYDPRTGQLSVKKSGRPVLANELGVITIYDNETKRRYSCSFSSAVWSLGNDRSVPKGYRVLHKNLNKSDCRLTNLTIISRSEYNELQEAVRNMKGSLKCQPHPTDQYKYVVSYQKGTTRRQETHDDIISAQKQMFELQLRFAKLINKYCIFD